MRRRRSAIWCAVERVGMRLPDKFPGGRWIGQCFEYLLAQVSRKGSFAICHVEEISFMAGKRGALNCRTNKVGQGEIEYVIKFSRMFLSLCTGNTTAEEYLSALFPGVFQEGLAGRKGRMLLPRSSGLRLKRSSPP